MPIWLENLLSSGAVWTAILALVNVVLKYVAPTLPPEILIAVNVLAVAILAALGVKTDGAIRAQRARRL